MKTESEVKQKIKEIEKDYEHVLVGSIATMGINAPRALMQIDAETKLQTLHWILGKKYKSRLNGIDT